MMKATMIAGVWTLLHLSCTFRTACSWPPGVVLCFSEHFLLVRYFINTFSCALLYKVFTQLYKKSNVLTFVMGQVTAAIPTVGSWFSCSLKPSCDC